MLNISARPMLRSLYSGYGDPCRGESPTEMTDRTDKIGPSRTCVKDLIIISSDMRHIYRPRWEIIHSVRRMKKTNEAFNYQVHPSPKIGQ